MNNRQGFLNYQIKTFSKPHAPVNTDPLLCRKEIIKCTTVEHNTLSKASISIHFQYFLIEPVLSKEDPKEHPESWKNVSVVMATCCSSREPEFGS